MTGEHVWKIDDDKWEYPNSEELSRKCGLWDIDIYIQRRRGTLNRYFDVYRKDLLNETKRCPKHPRDANKLMWWDQNCIITGPKFNF